MIEAAYWPPGRPQGDFDQAIMIKQRLRSPSWLHPPFDQARKIARRPPIKPPSGRCTRARHDRSRVLATRTATERL
jgi:hypothetical protein